MNVTENVTVAAEPRVRIRRHLKLHPMLTAFEVARALGLSVSVARRQLTLMEGDGEAVRHEVPRAPGDPRKTVKWEAT